VNLPDDLESWRDMAEEIAGWMKGCWISERTFDAMVRAKRLKPARVRGYTDGMAVLGELSGAHKELDLCQRLVGLGIIERKTEDGLVWYRWPV
jgi:hypothetical protein